MNISFDLDGTLITNGNEFETEYRSKIAGLFSVEKIRKDTSKLISLLENNGHRIHIYTTSFRSERKIRRNLKYYGIKVNKIINQTENKRILKEHKNNSSKYPPAFGFDIHIDDLKGVGIESEKYKFKAIIIEPTDNNWIEKILNDIENYISHYFKTTHFERMKMMESYFNKQSKINRLYIPEYNASKKINSILENNNDLSLENFKEIEIVLLKVKESEHFDGSHWYDYELHTNSLVRHRTKQNTVYNNG